jgi:hypothetical protein
LLLRPMRMWRRRQRRHDKFISGDLDRSLECRKRYRSGNVPHHRGRNRRRDDRRQHYQPDVSSFRSDPNPFSEFDRHRLNRIQRRKHGHVLRHDRRKGQFLVLRRDSHASHRRWNHPNNLPHLHRILAAPFKTRLPPVLEHETQS